MELSEKPQLRKPRVSYGPHRLHVSGVAARPFVPVADVMPATDIGDVQIAGNVVDIPTEIVSLDEPK